MVYVTNAGDDNVSVIDGNTNTIIATVGVGDVPLGVAVNSVINAIYVANRNDDNLSVISELTNSVIATIPAGSFPYGIGINP